MKQTMTRARLLASGLLGGGLLLGTDLTKAVEAAQTPVVSIVNEIPPASLKPRFAPGHWSPSGYSPSGDLISQLGWYDSTGTEQAWRLKHSENVAEEMVAIEQLILQHGGEYLYGGEAIGYDGKLLTSDRGRTNSLGPVPRSRPPRASGLARAPSGRYLGDSPYDHRAAGEVPDGASVPRRKS